jgi:hypothetical protein
LLPVVDAGELLGFAHVSEGDIRLSPLGQTFTDASILTRAEIIAGRLLRLLLIRWIYQTLQGDDYGRVAEAFFVDKLRVGFEDFASERLYADIR